MVEVDLETNPAADLDIVAAPRQRVRHNPLLRMEELPAFLAKLRDYQHGIRDTLSTALNELGYSDKWIEAQPSHADPNQVRAAYHHAEYIEQRRQMMQEWGSRPYRRGNPRLCLRNGTLGVQRPGKRPESCLSTPRILTVVYASRFAGRDVSSLCYLHPPGHVGGIKPPVNRRDHG